MRFISRKRRFMKWVGVVTCAAILILIAVTRRWGISWCSESFCGYFQCGEVALSYHFPFDAGWWDIQRNVGCFSYDSLLEYQPRDKYVIAPIWPFALAVAVPTLFAFLRDRRPPLGHCQNCGYDLTGNESGICPECGALTR